ncbi:ATP-binding protein [Streptomyces sp. NBC_01506]|uniref:ATP-binding protein n=1 Tax=Streptomyces sp. NBC_01506 TaxID=2903887 RepID=UPI00386F5473
MSRHCAGDRLVLPADALDDVLLVSSELVTNAVRGTDLVAFQLRIAGRSLYVEVWDRAPGVPEVNHADTDAEDGRGLRLVEALATRWGVCRPRAGGKVIWAELPLPADASPLGPEAGAELLADAVHLERTLTALRGL